MARIRSIKPEFWTDGDVMDLSMPARLLFIGSWNFAMCDFGHLADDARRLKMQVLPADPVSAEDLLQELIDAGRIVRIEVDGRSFLHIKRFTDHQKTERRWTPRCPVCASSAPANLAQPRPTSPDLSETPRTSTRERKGKERKGSNTCASTDVEREFAEWYAAYPRKRGKGQALKAYRAARKKADATTLLEAIKRQTPNLTAKGDEYVPYPATWLNGERWDDEPDNVHRLPSTDNQGRIILPPLPPRSPFGGGA